MTARISKSYIDGPVEGFAERVEAFLKSKRDHRDTIDVPAPTEHPLIEACIRRVRGTERDDYVSDYQIVDDA